MGILSKGMRGAALLAFAVCASVNAAAVALLKDINTVPVARSSYPDFLGAVPGGAVFSAKSRGVEAIWKSDGTPSGTVRVRNLSPNLGGARSPIAFDDKVIFVVGVVGGAGGQRIMVTEGTGASTDTIATISSFDINLIAVLNSTVAIFHTTSITGGSEIWRSDGTASGTVRLATGSSAYWNSFGQSRVAGKVYFALQRTASGNELWESDGTPAGTRLVQDLRLGTDSSNPRDFVTTGGYLYFTASEDDSRDVYRLLASSNAIERVADFASDQNVHAERMHATDGGLVFIQLSDQGRDALWRTDGTPAGTYELAGLDFAGFATPAAVLGDKLIFPAVSIDAGTQMWVSDGTVPGTHIIREIASGNDATEAQVARVTESRVFFHANEPATGSALWVTDGTRSGTRRVINAFSSRGAGIIHSGVTATKIYWTVTPNIMQWDDLGYELWVTDLQGGGAARLANNVDPHQSYENAFTAATANDHYFYALLDAEVGSEPAASDGTRTGTGLLRDIDPQTQNQSSIPRSFGHVGNLVIFTADDGLHGRELWRTDGTTEGTGLIADIDPGPATGASMSHPPFLAPQGFALFPAGDEDHGYELWRTDGSDAGTQLVADIIAGPGSGITSSCGEPFVANENVTFFAATTLENGQELWLTDGSRQRTRRVIDLNKGAADSSPCLLEELNGRVFFTAYASGSRNLWTSDGTAARTRRHFATGSDHEAFLPTAAVKFRDGLVLSNSNQVLWTDDTSADTRQLLTLSSSGAESIVWVQPLGARLLIGTAAGSYGRLYRWNGQSATATLINSTILNRSSETAVVGDQLAFVGYTVATGEEVYFTDGTREGTRVATDVSPEARVLSPRALVASGSTLYFHAYDLDGVHQLWRTRGDVASTRKLSSFEGDDEDGVYGQIAILNGQVIFGARDLNDNADTELYVHGNPPP